VVSADAIAIESTTTSAGNQVIWTLPVTVPDAYDVYARWGTSNSGAADAKYTITHAGGTDTVTLDQTTVYDGSWIKLGTYDLAPDAGHKVTLSDRANGQVAADAIRFVSASQGERVARWQGSVTGAGTYQVWARWTAAPTHTFAATYRVTTPGGTDSVTVDQRSGGGRWHLLKTLTLAANDNWQVKLSDQSPGEVVADAIAVTPPISLSDKFEWAPTLPAADDYAVYAKWQAEAGRATDAIYEITHDGGVAQVSVDQTRNGGDWRYLGSWSFDPLNSPKVTLLGSLTGTLSADAIRFVAGDAIGGDIAYTHADQLGTIQKMTDASGTLAWDRTARPFGETVSIGAASGFANPLRFPGQYADETGLSYNYFRDYDPTLGRYLESDPIGLGGGVNTYAYVGGNPISRMDPTGEVWQYELLIITINYLDCYQTLVSTDLELEGCVHYGRDAALSFVCVLQSMFVPRYVKIWAAAGRRAGRHLADGFGKGGNKGGDVSPTTGSGGGNKGGDTSKPKPDKPGKENDNPYDGPVKDDMFVGDKDGNIIPVKKGEQIASSKNGDYQQVKDANEKPTGVRYDRGGHKMNPDPAAQGPHAHVPGVTKPDGNPHLPLRPY
jgi:RHS repeat-associated protein